ncbi:hypothetical protein FISHEDRAFT_13956, partial [Fistulina hepatica ATCC 64428]
MSDVQTTASPHRNVVPSEVGWQFVPQYYTFVNKQPERLHCFYTKQSTFIHGTEGEDGKPCHGQQEIHRRIQSIGYQDCRVYIHSVDAQSSADGGIIIQVIGEMSNHDEPWRKFVQTFFLAEQPNGYFVLNDIFRFLKEDAVDSDEPGTEPGAAEETQTESVASTQEPVQEASREPTPPPRDATPPPAPVTREPTPPPAPESVPTPEAKSVTPEPVVKVPTPAPVAAPNGVPHAPPAEAPAATAAASPSPVPAAEIALAPEVKPATPEPPKPAAPPVPRTWATLAASNPKKWGTAVAQEIRGTSEAAPPSAPASGTSTPVSLRPSQAARPPQISGRQPVNVEMITTPHVFIKGVIDGLSNSALLNYLTTRYGPIKDSDVVRARACAFIEFQSLDSARKAIRDSSIGNGSGSGTGLWIDVDNGSQVSWVRISIEARKERGERPPPQAHSGTTSGFRGGDRGRGRGGDRGGRGRGAP